MDNSNSTIISITLGLLLSISEALPYIKTIKGNGIFDVFYQFIKKYKLLIIMHLCLFDLLF